MAPASVMVLTGVADPGSGSLLTSQPVHVRQVAALRSTLATNCDAAARQHVQCFRSCGKRYRRALAQSM